MRIILPAVSLSQLVKIKKYFYQILVFSAGKKKEAFYQLLVFFIW
jgi:hypothetical protein